MPVKKLYEAFLSLITSDEWENWADDEITADLVQIADAAKWWFKFPRCSLEYDESGEFFVDEKISSAEIQVWAQFMKAMWYGRVVDSWENLKPLYTERDFSPAKMLSEFNNRQKLQMAEAKRLEGIYYRAVDRSPFDYSTFVD